MAEVAAEEARRQALIAEARKKQQGGGKRGSVNFCDTVVPILSGKDLGKVKDIVDSKIEAFQSLGSPFDDDDFSPYPVLGKFGDWKRLTEMYPDGELFKDGSKASDPLQGSIGDCWFIAAMSTVAGDADESTMEGVFLCDSKGAYMGNLEAGVHVVSFYSDYVRYAVIIDDKVPASYNQPSLCKASHEGAIWPCLVEKAYGKFFSSTDGYDQLSGGLPHRGIKSMTNAATECCSHTPRSERVVSGKLWQDLISWHQNDFFIGAGSGGDDDTNKTSGNIVMGHAFSVLDVQQIDQFKLLRLRNPWGKTESNLDWSDKSSMWDKYPRVSKKLEHDDKDDGEFWIEFGDYVRYFDITDCCMFAPRDSWDLISESGSIVADGKTPTYTLTGPDFGSSDQATIEGYPQFWITARRNVTLVIDIEQTQRTQPANVEVRILHKKGRKRLKRRYQGTRMGSTNQSCSGFNFAVELQAADEPHLLVLTWDAREEKEALPVEMHIRRRKVDADRFTVERAAHDAEVVN